MKKGWIGKALASLVFCIGLSAQAQQHITITDARNRTVKVPTKVTRTIALGPGTLRLLTYIQALDLVVGVEEIERKGQIGRPYAMANPQLAKLPRVGKGGGSEINKKPDLEAILAIKPDVIFITYMDASKADEVQRLLGIPVVVLTYGRGLGSFDEAIHDSIALAGKILKREQRAAAVSDFIRQAQRDLKQRTKNIPQSQRASAYVGAISKRGAHGIESSEQKYAPFDWLGVNNLAKQFKPDSGTYVKLEKESLLKLNPPVVFIDSGGWKLVQSDYAKNKPFYQALQAFQQGKVYRLHPFNWYTTNIDTVITDAYAVGKALYPKQFSDIDIAKKSDAIYQFLVGKPVYQQMKGQYGALGEHIRF